MPDQFDRVNEMLKEIEELMEKQSTFVLPSPADTPSLHYLEDAESYRKRWERLRQVVRKLEDIVKQLPRRQ